MTDWQYGRFDTVWARLTDGRLAVRVDGVKPAPWFQARLRPYAPDADSTADVQLGLYWHAQDATPAAEPAAYTASAEVDIRGVEVTVVRVYHASGFVDLRVRRGTMARGSPNGVLESVPE